MNIYLFLLIIADLSAIWYIKPRLPKELFSYEPIEHRNFIHKQFFEMRRTIWSMFNDKKWLNNPWSIDKAENKPYQLLEALESGFNTPDTVITSDPELVMDFYNKHSKDIIVKLLSSSIIPDHVIYTNKVTDEYMSEISSVKMSPSIFQETVKKDHELRITVVGNRLFPVKIYSQEDSETSLDWRKKPKFNDFKVRMESAVLPREVETKIFVFMNKLGLDFGCIDMIVDENGDYIFLEINSNGQWYFVQLNTGAKIAEAIASELIS